MADVSHLVGSTYATVRKAFDQTSMVQEKSEGQRGEINLSRVFSRIIAEAGRFTDDYASDILYGIDDVKALLLDKDAAVPEDGIDEILVFAVRQFGVDHASYLMNQLLRTRHELMGYVFPTPYYRRVLAVRCVVSGKRATCELKEISGSLVRIDDEDLDDRRQVVYRPVVPKQAGT